MGAAQFSAAISAVKEKSILAGLRIERTEVGEAGEFDGLSQADFAAKVMERLAGLEKCGETEH